MLFVFIFANLPLPLVFYLNCVVTWRYWRVHRLTRHRRAKKPRQVTVGWWLGNISMIFAFGPSIYERQFFVQNHWWLVSYAIAATLSITGLRLQEKGLARELKILTRRRARAAS